MTFIKNSVAYTTVFLLAHISSLSLGMEIYGRVMKVIERN